MADDLGDIIFTTTAQGTSLELPDEVKLEQQIGYEWRLEVILGDQSVDSGKGRFFTANSNQHTTFDELAELSKGSRSDRILYLIYLDALDLKLEFRTHLKRLIQEFPKLAAYFD